MKKWKAFSVLQNKTYSKLFLANVTSQMGTFIGSVAFTLYLLDRFAKQPFYATLTQMMNSLPVILVFFLVGVFADRLDRQKIALYTDWIRFVLTLLFLASIPIGSMALTFAVLFARSGVAKFFQPAESGLVQGILKEEEYTTAAGLNQMVVSIFALFGTGLGTISYWLLGVEGSILIDAVSFLVSGLLIRSCNIAEEVRLPNGRTPLRELKLLSVFKDLKSGLRYIFEHPLILALVSSFFLFGVINGGFSVLPLFLMKYKLAPDSYEIVGVWRGVAFGVGIMIGSIAAAFVAKKLKLYQMLIVGLLSGGVFVVANAFVEQVYLYLVIELLFAFTMPFVNVALGGWLPKIIDPKMMGRVQGWADPLMMSASALTLALISMLFPERVAVEILYGLVGGSILLVGIFYWLVLPRLIDKHESTVKSVQTQELTAVQA